MNESNSTTSVSSNFNLSTSNKVDKFLKKIKQAQQLTPQSSPQDVVIVDSEKGVVLKTLNEEHIKLFTQEMVDLLLDKVRDKRDVKMAHALLRQLIEIKKSYWPATQKSITTNIDIWDEQIKKWIAMRQGIITSTPQEIKVEIEQAIKQQSSQSQTQDEELGDGR